MQGWVQITHNQTTEITDPLKVLDSFSVFVEPILSYHFSFVFSVVHNSTLGKILEVQLTLISARQAKHCYRSPSFVTLKIPDICFSPPVLFIQLTFHSWVPLGYILFKDTLKRHSRYNVFQPHCTLIIKCSPVSTSEIYALPQPPQT